MSVITPHQIHSLVHTLDPNVDKHTFPIACIVLDVTLNRTTNPYTLAIRYKCSIVDVYKWLSNLFLHRMLSPHWLEEDNINIIEFWLHVLVAKGDITTQRSYAPKYTFGPIIKETKYIVL